MPANHMRVAAPKVARMSFDFCFCFGASRCVAIVRRSAVFCSSMFSNRIGVAASWLFAAAGACVIAKCIGVTASMFLSVPAAHVALSKLATWCLKIALVAALMLLFVAGAHVHSAVLFAIFCSQIALLWVRVAVAHLCYSA